MSRPSTPAGPGTPSAPGRPRPLGVAVVGAGLIAAVHRRAALLAGAEVVGVLASAPERSREVAARWGVERAYEDIDAVLADDRVQVVHICTPTPPMCPTPRPPCAPAGTWCARSRWAPTPSRRGG
ncbi:hypothetical protein GCM10010524_34460 [Streptomyces mexicanus]